MDPTFYIVDLVRSTDVLLFVFCQAATCQGTGYERLLSETDSLSPAHT